MYSTYNGLGCFPLQGETSSLFLWGLFWRGNVKCCVDVFAVTADPQATSVWSAQITADGKPQQPQQHEDVVKGVMRHSLIAQWCHSWGEWPWEWVWPILSFLMGLDKECPGNRRKVEVVHSAVFSESSPGSPGLHLKAFINPSWCLCKLFFPQVLKSFHVQKCS